MLKSMTGYGRFEQQNGSFSCKAEIRSVNNRFIEISARLPKYLSCIELPLKNMVKARCARGSFDVFITIEKDSSSQEMEIRPNLDLATQYHNAFKEIQDQLGLHGNIEISSLLSMRDIIKSEPMEFDEEKQKLILDTVNKGLTELIRMREEEGKSQSKDLSGRLDEIEDWIDKIRSRQPEIINAYRDKLQEKIKTISDGIDIDPARLAQETAIIADKSDIAEELTRLESHLAQFRELIKQDQPVGRKLEFLTQEINRETNTIGSKSIDFEVSQHVVEIKSLLEKIREQLANIE
ncbi:MAG: YicC family protein [Candidatus Nitronauta litoralis]|uniref:YicC family protein n=1 Tax=Candidatus Nitronauta litoralis TaxID=2705533 RepID=A0A7T0BZ07_9BACT|nr:MAG: YicC family protein [Candidatus Nitronauta litoralis]